MFAYLLYLILDVVIFHLFHCLCLGCCNFMSCLFLGQVWFAAHLNSAHLRCSHVFSALLICFRSSQRLSSLLSSSQLFSLLACLQCGNFSSKVYLVRSESGPNLRMNMDRHIMRIKIRNQQQAIIDTDIDFHSSKLISHYQHISIYQQPISDQSGEYFSLPNPQGGIRNAQPSRLHNAFSVLGPVLPCYGPLARFEPMNPETAGANREVHAFSGQSSTRVALF